MKKNLKNLKRSKSLNTSVSTYGKNKLRVITNELNWLQVQDNHLKKGLFSDSDHSDVIKVTPNVKPKKTQKRVQRKKGNKLLAKQSHQKFRKVAQHETIVDSTSNALQQNKLASPGNIPELQTNSRQVLKKKSISVIKVKINDCNVSPSSSQHSFCMKLSSDTVSSDSLLQHQNYQQKCGHNNFYGEALSGSSNFSIDFIAKDCKVDMLYNNRLKSVSGDDISWKKSYPFHYSSVKTTPCSVDLSKDKVLCEVAKNFSKSRGRSVKHSGRNCTSASNPSSIAFSKFWPIMNNSKAKHINVLRRRRNVSFKLTDGLSTFSFMEHFQGANESIAAFQNSVVHGHHDLIFDNQERRDPIIKGFSTPHFNVAIQSTPMVLNKPAFSLTETPVSSVKFSERSFLSTPGSPDVIKPRRQQPPSLLESFLSNSMNKSPLKQDSISLILKSDDEVSTYRDKVLQECKQMEPCSFESLGYHKSNVTKLGEGLYGEVYRCTSSQLHIAVKVIPVEGDVIINGEKQKTFCEVLPEIVNSTELSLLSNNTFNRTNAFINLFGVHCALGSYPTYFLVAWDEYEEEQVTENERPDCFPDNQLYIVFEYTDGGIDLEHFQFKNASQAISVLQQTVAGLAVAEEAYQFEHRDLHWGNILIAASDTTHIEYTVEGETQQIKTQGVTARIIDFTLSRITKGGLCLYQDLSEDVELFEGDEAIDYQFEIYRMMKRETGNDWALYRPKTNVFWIHYLLEKFLLCVNYRNKRSKIHKSSMNTLKILHESVLQCNSCTEILNKTILFNR